MSSDNIPPTPGSQEINGITADERSSWLYRALEEDPELLELRERTYPWAGSHSFGVLKRAEYSSCRAHLDRYKVLELVYQHLHSIGMHHAAYTLSEETQLEFQRKDMVMDRTDLRLLVSMSLGPRDDLWDNTGIDSTILANEPFDDDNCSVKFIEPLDKTIDAFLSPETDVDFIEGEEHKFSGIAYSTLRNLIVALVRKGPIIVEKEDKEDFFLTLRSFCQNEHFFNHLKELYQNCEVDFACSQSILELIEEWIKFEGLFIGKRTLKQIEKFVSQSDDPIAARILESFPNLVYGHPRIDDSTPPKLIDDPEQIKSILDPNFSLTDADPAEAARQISLYIQKIFSSINLREFYTAITTRTLSLDTKTINELFESERRLKYLIAATILVEKDEAKCVNKLEKMIKIALELLEINNFEGVSWFVSAFNMQCIKNLTKIFNKLPKDIQNKLEEISNNFGWKVKSPEYEERINQLYKEQKPAIPNLRYELSIVTTCCYEGKDFKDGKINWQKRRTAAKFLRQYCQFQNTKYNFQRISQIQNLLSRGSKLTKEKLNQLSLEMESPIKDN